FYIFIKVKDDNKIISDWKARQIAELFVIVIFIVKITKILILLLTFRTLPTKIGRIFLHRCGMNP
ncbi:hypothetical protein P9743_08915, partial [Anoxybacillus geothermalis]|nr:hypothetical protein [Anoxybacillus geothermalis]